MAGCCSPKGYRWIFSEGMARSELRRYRSRGLDGTSRRIVDYLKTQGVEGQTVLEVGGGIGAVQVELLEAGASTARSVELTPSYEEVAEQLLRERGLDGRVERTVADFAKDAPSIEPADIVIMNRVVCCYPDMPVLAAAGARHARQTFVLTFPRRSWWIRYPLAIANFMLWLTRREFKIFVHPPAQILATAETQGLRTVLDESGLMWTVAALRRVETR